MRSSRSRLLPHRFHGVVDEVAKGALHSLRVGEAPAAVRASERITRTLCVPPAKSASEFSTMVFRSAGRGIAVGNCASDENWSTSERMLCTERR